MEAEPGAVVPSCERSLIPGLVMLMHDAGTRGARVPETITLLLER